VPPASRAGRPMSPITLSSRADRALPRRPRWKAAACAGLLALALPAVAAANHLDVPAPPLPASVLALAPGLVAQGGGEMTFLGLPIYRGWYWSPGHEWRLDAPFAIDLHYQRMLDGGLIAQRSVSEIEKLGLGTPEQLKRWGEAMRRIFPDVANGDQITGIFLPPGIVRYFLNGKPIGEVVDASFARAFFGIWLDPRTSRADFRAKLLGGS
jgi:hypothetical protein